MKILVVKQSAPLLKPLLRSLIIRTESNFGLNGEHALLSLQTLERAAHAQPLIFVRFSAYLNLGAAPEGALGPAHVYIFALNKTHAHADYAEQQIKLPSHYFILLQRARWYHVAANSLGPVR